MLDSESVSVQVMLTVWRVSDKRSPSSLRTFHQSNLDLDLAYRVITRVGIDLALQGLENERFLAMDIGELQ